MGLISINHHPTRRQLWQFGFLWLVFLGGAGALAYFKHDAHRTAVVLWVLSLVLPLIGWIFPAFMRIVFLTLSYAAFPIGFVVSYLILALVYYLVLTPVGLLMRVFGYDPMQRKMGEGSYWTERSETPGASQYFRQF